MRYIDSDCDEQSVEFNNPDICVPCPEVTAEIEQENCSNSVTYNADLYSGECNPVSGNVEWEFFLNNVSVGTSNSVSGTFTYNGSEDFEGDFRAEVSYFGSYGTGCTLPEVTDTETITLFTKPEAEAGNYGPICDNADVITLTGQPTDSNGAWTGSGVTDNGDGTASFDPSGLTGTITTTYTYTDGNNCSDTDTADIVINKTAVVEAGSYGPICDNADAITLTGQPTDSNGTWTGTGVTDNGDGTASFDPDGLTGAITVTYTYEDDNNCSDSDTADIVINKTATVEAGNYGPICDNADAITLTGQPTDSNGAWTGTNVTDNGDGTASFDPDGLTGTITVTYTYEDGNNCSDSDTTDIVINKTAIVEAGDYGPICDNADIITLTGQPTNSNGAWTGTNVTDNGDGTASFDPTGLNGTITATYTYTDGNSCSGEDTADIFVNMSPDAPISSGDIAECKDETTTQTLDANDAITVATGTSVVWYTDATGNTVVNTPTLDAVGSVTYYAEAVSDTGSCSSSGRTPVTLTIYNCSISIEKTAIPNDTQNCNTIAPGEMITYTFKVKNLGDVAINNVEVNDPLIDNTNPIPGPDSGDTTNSGVLDVGEEWTYEATYTVTQQDIINGQVNNTATVDGTVTGSSASFNVNDSDSVTVNLCQDADISIVKSSTSESQDCLNLEVGNTIEYKFVVKNEGDVDITDVVITDPLFLAPNPVVAIQLVDNGDGNGVLNVGETWEYEAIYTVDQDNINDGQVENTATVNGTTGLGPVNDTSNTITIPICQDASIALIKESTLTIDPNTGCYEGEVGDVINYTFSVKNTGDVTLTNIIVTDLVGGVTMSGGPIASLDPNEEDTTTFTATYTLTQADLDAGEFVNQALATGTPPQGDDVTDESDNSEYTEDDSTVVPICQDASIALIKESTLTIDPNTGCYEGEVGDVINYTFSVKNTGDVTLTNIIVTDLVGGVTMSGGPIASLDPNEEDTTTFTATYTLTQADLDAGEFVNQALATGTPPQGDDVTDESDNSEYTEDDSTVVPICQDASIALIKESTLTIDPNTGCYEGEVGDVINYTFSVKNTGDVTLTNIIVTDLVGGVTMSGGPIASLDPNEEDTTTFTATYTLTQADLDAGEFVNRALATGTPPQGDDVTDESDNSEYTEDDSTVVPICQDASIALIKESTLTIDPNTGCYEGEVGDVINYTFSVKNTGDVTLTNIIVTDLVGGVTMSGGPIASLDPNEEDTTTFTATYTLTQADLDAGEFVNQALATGTPPQGDDVTDESDNSEYTEDDSTVVPICQDASIALIKESTLTIDPNTGCYEGEVGDVINYTFSVKNTGDVTLTNIIVTDLVGGVTMSGGPIASLDPNEEDTTTFTATYTLTQADLDAGEFVNRALATGTPPQGDDVTDESDNSEYTEDDSTVVPICQDASIALIKESTLTIDPNTGCYAGEVGDVISYTFSVKNTGRCNVDQYPRDRPSGRCNDERRADREP